MINRILAHRTIQVHKSSRLKRTNNQSKEKRIRALASVGLLNASEIAGSLSSQTSNGSQWLLPLLLSIYWSTSSRNACMQQIKTPCHGRAYFTMRVQNTLMQSLAKDTSIGWFSRLSCILASSISSGIYSHSSLSGLPLKKLSVDGISTSFFFYWAAWEAVFLAVLSTQEIFQ